MKILNEKDCNDVIWDIEFEGEEYNTLFEYAQMNIPEDVLQDLMVNWAIVEAFKAVANCKNQEEYKPPVKCSKSGIELYKERLAAAAEKERKFYHGWED